MKEKAEKDKFFLTYLIFKDSQKMLGHSAIGISQISPDGSQKLLFRVGLFPANQVMIEDFIIDKTGREFYCKQFPINEEQLTQVLTKINHDRKLMTPAPLARKPEKKDPIPERQSIPRGEAYHKLTNNCKDYALSVLKAANITHTLDNQLISLPVLSGHLDRVCIEQGKDGIASIHPKGSKAFSVVKLAQYIKDRQGSGKEHLSVFGSFFGYSKETKISTAKKLQSLLSGDPQEVSFSKEEYGALRSGKLGNIFQEAKKCGHVPRDLIKIENITASNITLSYKMNLNEIKKELTNTSDTLTTWLKFHR